ncbi:MAG: hypothetical protein AAF437_13695 [Pseudomonadota bacterium]
MPWGEWLLSAAFTAISFSIALIACRFVMRIGIVDAPDGARKMQTVAVPRLGGVAILIGTLFGGLISLCVLALAYGIHPVDIFAILFRQITGGEWKLSLMLAFVGAAFLIGLWDDVFAANTKLKLLIMATACFAIVAAGLKVTTLDTPWGGLNGQALLLVGSALWLLVFTNASNFMDGANGLAIGSLAIMIASLALTGVLAGDFIFSVWWFPVLGSVAGFLVQNLRGHLYAGDAGALALGALFSGLGLMSGLQVWTVATIGLPFLLDVLLTLVWRAKHQRNWLDAHLDHAYQRLIASGWSHVETASLYWAMSATAGVLAYIGAKAGGAAPFLVFWTLTVAGSMIWVIHRRSAQRHDFAD